MEEIKNIPSWEEVKELILIADKGAIKEYFDSLSSEEIVLTISHLDKEDRSELFALLSPSDAAGFIEEIPEVQATDILERLSSQNAAAIMNELKSNDQADLMVEFKKENAEAIMAEMEPKDVENVRRLIEYGPDTAGGLMITEFLAFDESMTVKDVTEHLRDKSEEYTSYNVQYIYVTEKNRFAGVLQMRNLVLTKPGKPIGSIAIKNALTVNHNTSIEELINFFDTNDFYGVPVIDDEQHLVGVVLRKDIREEEMEIANQTLLQTQGIVGGEELRTMPFFLRSRRRLSWLSVNILLNIVAASVIAMYQDTLSAAITLAVFLPIISDMSGCSGNQAVAVSMRELSLGVVKPFELLRVWTQEISVGIINGLALGGLLGLAAWLWQGSVYLGLVVGTALCLNTMIAVSLGGTIPLILKRMDIDPALASGPILTTVTDMFGFFLALSLATLALAQFGSI